MPGENIKHCQVLKDLLLPGYPLHRVVHFGKQLNYKPRGATGEFGVQTWPGGTTLQAYLWGIEAEGAQG